MRHYGLNKREKPEWDEERTLFFIGLFLITVSVATLLGVILWLV